MIGQLWVGFLYFLKGIGLCRCLILLWFFGVHKGGILPSEDHALQGQNYGRFIKVALQTRGQLS